MSVIGITLMGLGGALIYAGYKHETIATIKKQLAISVTTTPATTAPTSTKGAQ